MKTLPIHLTYQISSILTFFFTFSTLSFLSHLQPAPSSLYTYSLNHYYIHHYSNTLSHINPHSCHPSNPPNTIQLSLFSLSTPPLSFTFISLISLTSQNSFIPLAFFSLSPSRCILKHHHNHSQKFHKFTQKFPIDL